MKRKAFTLAELLVVVIVLGTLAAVSVPKLSTVLETRRTVEAESVLSAMRTEQEKRCISVGSYTKDSHLTPLASVGISKNYKYSFLDAGAKATNSSKGYSIQMPSYKDGGFCCEGDYCSKLNKSYPDCSSISIPDDECAESTIEGDEGSSDACDSNPNSCSCSSYASANACECNPSTATCCSSGEEWNGSACVSVCSSGEEWNGSACVSVCSSGEEWNGSACVALECDEADKPTATGVCGPCNLGTLVYTYTCNNGAWEKNGASCVGIPSDACGVGATQTQTCGNGGTQTRTCSSECVWGAWSECTGETCANGTREDGTCKEPVYAGRYVPTGTPSVPACSVSTSGCSSMTVDNCKSFRTPTGNIISSVANGEFCVDKTCNGDSYGFVCITQATVTNDDSRYYCNYVLHRCERYIATYR